jgi:hypothetical protein
VFDERQGAGEVAEEPSGTAVVEVDKPHRVRGDEQVGSPQIAV